jgi:YEATS domain-containing protein 4
MQIFFHDDAAEGPLELYHHLQLGLDAHGNPQRKPHLYEVYEEIVFWEPTEAFYNRVKAHVPQPAPVSQLAQYFGKFDAAADYSKVQNARRRLAPLTAHFRAQLAAIEAEEAATNAAAGVTSIEAA